jgi:hypothetical protein
VGWGNLQRVRKNRQNLSRYLAVKSKIEDYLEGELGLRYTYLFIY